MNAVLTDKTKVVRERRFMTDGHESVLRALSQLEREGATGALILDMNQGGIGSIRFQEEQRIVPNGK